MQIANDKSGDPYYILQLYAFSSASSCYCFTDIIPRFFSHSSYRCILSALTRAGQRLSVRAARLGSAARSCVPERATGRLRADIHVNTTRRLSYLPAKRIWMAGD